MEDLKQTCDAFGPKILLKFLDAVQNDSFSSSELQRRIDQMILILKTDPYLCEQLFVPIQYSKAENLVKKLASTKSKPLDLYIAKTSAFEVALSILGQSNNLIVADGVMNALTMAITQVGLGLEHLFALVSLLTKTGRWPASSLNILNGMHALASHDPAPRPPAFTLGEALGRPSIDSGPPPLRRPPGPYFRLDGDGGLYLGGAADWPFDKGYAFEAWLHPAAAAAAAPQHLFRIVAADASGGEAAAVLEARLAGERFELKVLHSARVFSCSVPVAAAAGRWVHVVVSHARSMISSKVHYCP